MGEKCEIYFRSFVLVELWLFRNFYFLFIFSLVFGWVRMMGLLMFMHYSTFMKSSGFGDAYLVYVVSFVNDYLE
jgi:hypothetical protein